MPVRPFALAGTLVFLSTGLALARQEPRPLTLDAAVTEALARNPDLAALRRNVAAMQSRPAQTRALDAPMLEGQIWRWPIDTLNPANANMYMFGIGQSFPGPGKRTRREAAARAEVRVSEAEIDVLAREIAAEVRRAYADLRLARRSLALHHDTDAVLRQITEVAQVRYASGRGPQSDVVASLSELARFHDHLISLAEGEQRAAARLNALLNRPPQQPVPALAAATPLRLQISADALQALAFREHPELEAARREVTRAEATLAAATRESSPDFFARAAYMLMPSEGDAWSATAGIAWNRSPWSRGRFDARTAEAAEGVEAARAERAVVENRLRLAVHDAYIRVASAADRLALLATTLEPQADQVVAVARVAYEADRGPLDAVLSGERLRLEIAVGREEALHQLERALADLERAVGTDLPPGMLSLTQDTAEGTAP